MEYNKPKIQEVMLETEKDYNANFGYDTQERCSRSCCFAGGKDW